MSKIHHLGMVALALGVSCNTGGGGGGERGPRVVVHAPAGLAAGAQPAVDDLVADLGRLTGEEVTVAALPAPPCRPGELHVAVLGHQHDVRGAAAPATGDPQGYSIDEQRCGDGHVVTLRGGSLLAGQWAIYELLERLGVRYFHPEATLYPVAAAWPAEPLRIAAAPAFRRRSMHLHTTHPVELSPPTDTFGLDLDGRQRRWIDWNVKLRQTSVDGWEPRWAGTRAYDRGFPRSAGLNLLNSQQGGRPVLDPDDPRPEEVQLAEAIDELMAAQPGLPAVSELGVQFNPSEFTVADEVATVRRLTALTEYVSARWPEVALFTINHGTAQPPGPVHGIRFFDLPELAPPELGVKVHPLMFYDLDRPAAGAYGNDDFRHLQAWVRTEAAVRRITYYPEASWWLTFDLPVPLLLAPVTIEARAHDIELLRADLATSDDATTGVWGHHLFTSGQEWGYWMIDYCTARMAWDADLGWPGCVEHVVAGFADGATIGRVLREVATRQISDLRTPALVRMLVGSDDETEAAADAGIIVHPLPPPPASVLTWDDAAVAAFRAESLEPLDAMATAYETWAEQIEATLPAQSPSQAPWVRELRDGLRVFALRARHARAIYDTALALRLAIRAGDAAAIEAAAAGVEAARAVTAAARAVIAAREADYRYPPELATEGDEAGTPGAVANQTIYPFRVLSRTHRAFYWTRPDDQLAAMFGAARLDAGHAGDDQAAFVGRRLEFPRGSLTVIEPGGAARLKGLLPGLVVGLGRDGADDVVVLGGVDGEAVETAHGALRLELRRIGPLTIHAAVITAGEGSGADDRRLSVTGELATDEVIALLVSAGGFDEPGARRLVAATLGYTVETLPAQVPFALTAIGREP